MHTYTAGKNGARELRYAGTREWVFPLLPTRRYRDRVDVISDLELKRRPDCEPTLRALVTDDWTPETIHHVGWCDSCRAAGFALGAGAFAGGRAAPAPNRSRALMLAVAAAAVIAVPAVASQVVDNPFGAAQTAVRGGIAHVVHVTTGDGSHHATRPTGSKGSTGASGSGSNGSGSKVSGSNGSGSTGSKTPKEPAKIIPKPRSRPLGGAIASHRSTVIPSVRVQGRLPHTT